MIMEREKVKFIAGQDINLKVGISKNINSSLGRQESDYYNLIKQESDNIINPAVDNEIVRFRYSNSDTRFIIYYYDQVEEEYNESYNNTGFTDNEINLYSPVLRNSFYILDFYDSFSVGNKEKIFTQYYSKFQVVVGVGDKTGSSINEGVNIASTPQLSNLYVPLWYMDSILENTFELYFTLTFYNAKTGKVIPFFNNDYYDSITNEFTNTTGERISFRCVFNKATKMWYITSPTETEVKALQYTETQSSLYNDKVNSSVEITNMRKLQTPEPKNFKYIDRTYN